MKRCLHAVLILGAMLGCNPVMENQITTYPSSLSDYKESGDYEIDPGSIRDSLRTGNGEVFRPVGDPAQTVATPYPPGSFLWSQADFFEVASALHDFVWHEPLANWSIFGMVFWRRCSNNSAGFETADLTYFRPAADSRYYDARTLRVYPAGGGVSWGGGSSFPRPLLGWRGVDPARLKVSADDALESAEEAGGRQARLSVNDECTIIAQLQPNVTSSDWVLFYDSVGKFIFQIRVNPYTGQRNTIQK